MGRNVLMNDLFTKQQKQQLSQGVKDLYTGSTPVQGLEKLKQIFDMGNSMKLIHQPERRHMMESMFFWYEDLRDFSKAENQDPQSSLNYAMEELAETMKAYYALKNCKDPSIVEDLHDEVVDGVGDVLFVMISFFRKFCVENSIKEDDAFGYLNYVIERICKANKAKLGPNGQFIYDKKGKIKKPDGWKAPTFKDLTLSFKEV